MTEVKARSWFSSAYLKNKELDPKTWIDERCVRAATDVLKEEYEDLCSYYLRGTRPHGWTNDDVYMYLMETRRTLLSRGQDAKLPWGNK